MDNTADIFSNMKGTGHCKMDEAALDQAKDDISVVLLRAHKAVIVSVIKLRPGIMLCHKSTRLINVSAEVLPLRLVISGSGLSPHHREH